MEKKWTTGDFVKILFDSEEARKQGCAGERMWVQVIMQKRDGVFVGRLKNNSTFTPSLVFGSKVEFHEKDVLEFDLNQERKNQAKDFYKVGIFPMGHN